MTKSNKLGVLLLWLTGLLIFVAPLPFVKEKVIYWTLGGLYIFITWVRCIVGLIFKRDD